MIDPLRRMITMVLHVKKRKETYRTKFMSNASNGNIWCSFTPERDDSCRKNAKDFI